MNKLQNIFSILSLDTAEDSDQLTQTESSKRDDNSSSKSGKEKGKQKEINKSEKTSTENSTDSLNEYRMPLVWIDLEMTGLDVTKDRILEIACIITNGNLTKSIEGPDLVIHQTKECLDNMGEWCTTHHADSGLTQRVLKSTITEREAEKQVIEFVKKHVGSQTPQLAGNSVYCDFLFLKKYMPSLAELFSHVLVDVSSIMALCIRWFPREKKKAPQKKNNHRAMDDIKESIQELKFYKENIFKFQKSKH
ncbi:hypothetical protein LUZ60_012738 [Juncus effusus]|nr:hypothetical protein LUZ60_012738 [Juncus effusus]